MKSSAIKIFIPLTLVFILGACSNSSNQKADKQKSDQKHTIIKALDSTSLNTAYRPQDDFDSFANGGWKKLNPIPSTEGTWGAFGILDKENSEVKLKGIIQETLKNKGNNTGSDEQKIADMYRSFIDTNTINKLGLSPLKKYSDQIKNIRTLNEWIEVSGELQKIGIPGVLGIYVDADDRNSKMNAVKWVQGGLSLGEKSYYSGKDERMKMIRSEFVKHVDKMLSLSNWYPPENFKPGNGNTLLAFETSLAKIQLSNVELRDPLKTYNKVAATELKRLAKNTEWASFSSKQGIHSDTIILQNTVYITKLDKLLTNTHLEDLKLYTYYQLIKTFASYLPQALKNEKFNFYGKIKSGIKEQKKRDIQAIDITESLGEGNILGRLYAKRFFPETSKKKVAGMIENVRLVYGERIDKLSWMGDSTKLMAKKKLSTFTYKIGYPDKWEDYTGISIQPSSLIDNVINNTLWSHNKMLNDVGKPVDRNRWFMSPQTVNAYYNQLNNEIVFPAGILQAPFFNPDADDAVNYGGIIAVIGHEFTHGFDDQGAQYDEVGNLKNWWTKKDSANFRHLSGSYITYFNSFEPLPGVNINGALTIGENIADLGGLTLSYYALLRSIKDKPELARIDGFTWQQRFFLSWAQVWHNNIKDEELRNRLQTDPHSPARYRINGPLKHLPEFYSAFDVKEGDKMWLPESERIVIW